MQINPTQTTTTDYFADVVTVHTDDNVVEVSIVGPWGGATALCPSEARAFASMLLAAADQVERK